MLQVSDLEKSRFGTQENGRQKELTGEQEATPERDARGRFAKGNKGGPGNPFARTVARFRTKLLESVTEEQIEEVIQALVRRATNGGDNQAAKILLAYVVGTPKPAPEPDRMEIEEFEQMRETATMLQRADKVAGVDPEIALAVARTLRQGQTIQAGELIAQMISGTETVDHAVVGEAAPSPNGGSPSPNGSSKQRVDGSEEPEKSAFGSG